MPFSDRQERREYDRKRYAVQKQSKKSRPKDDDRKRYFPLRLSESVIGQASRMAAEAIVMNKYPWKTPSDVLRAMINLGLKTLASEGDELAQEIEPTLHVEEHLDTLKRHRRQAQGIYGKAHIEIAELIKMGADDSAANVYAATIEEVDKMQKTEWTEWILRQLKAEYPTLHRRYVDMSLKHVKLSRPTSVKDERRQKQLPIKRDRRRKR